MKLVTQNGQLDLPRDFSMTMERTNPLISSEGDSSIPATLPSSPRNLADLGHRERLDRAEKYANKVEAILEIGPIRKHGQLAIDTVHRRNGIAASFYIDNSDLYITSKNKTLKEIFATKVENFGNVEDACAVMQRIYQGDVTDSDYVIFPVAVAPYEEKDVTVYQYNNKIDSNLLVWDARYLEVHEGDEIVSVPNGYSVAPFLKLHRMVDLLFTLLGYTVTENCLTDWPFAKLAIVHNCSDCLCNPSVTLYYRDLVPSCSLSAFLDWLNNKWHVQPVVDSETRHVKIVAMESMLKLRPDLDITPILEGDFTVQLNPSKRVVLTPTNSIDGTDPAASTFDKLLEKYGSFVYVDETEFGTLESNDPAVQGGLVQRRSTGLFYSLEYDSNNNQQVLKPVGTNHFTYDRGNSEESEDFSQGDSLPLMLCGLIKPGQTRDVVPFIGDRQHAHTTYKGSTADDKQDIIVVQAVLDKHLFYFTTGTTQPVIPYDQPEDDKEFLELSFGTTPYDLYDACWCGYNNLLLNHPTHLKGRVKYTIGQILGMDLARLKLCQGQKLLPVCSSSTIGAKTKLTEAEFMLVKTFVDGVADSPILPSELSNYVWEVTDNALSVVEDLWIGMGGTAGFGDIDVPTSGWNEDDRYLHYGSYSAQYIGENLNPGTPGEGDVVTLSRLANITVYYYEVVEYIEGQEPASLTFERYTVFRNVPVEFTFTAVPA